MNKSYVSNVVSRYSNKVIKDVSSILPKGPASSYSGLDGIVEDEPPTAAAGRVSAFFEACSKIKAAEGKGDPGKVSPNKKQRAGIKRKEREEKMIKLSQKEEIEREKFIKAKAEQYANRLRVGLAKRALSQERADTLHKEKLLRLDTLHKESVDKLVRSDTLHKEKELLRLDTLHKERTDTLHKEKLLRLDTLHKERADTLHKEKLLRLDTLHKERVDKLVRSDTLHKEKEEEDALQGEESKKRRKLLKQKVQEKVRSLVEKRKARLVQGKGKHKQEKKHWRIVNRSRMNDSVVEVDVSQWMGAQIVLRNLKSKPELNGTRCVVTGVNDTGDRYVVTTDKGVKLSVMVDKLELVDVEEVLNLISPKAVVIKGSVEEKFDKGESPMKHYEAKVVAAEIERAAEPIVKDVWSSPDKSVKTVAKTVAAELERAAELISKDVWTSPGKLNKRGKGLLGAESEGSRDQSSYGMRPLKLEALSVFTRNAGISPMVWYERGRRAIRSLAIFEQKFSEQQAIAAIMDRAEAGSEVERWFGSLDSEVWSNGDRFDKAFRKRFDSSRTVDSALEKLLVIRSSGFSSIDTFYTSTGKG